MFLSQSSTDKSYTTDITNRPESFDEHKTLSTIGFILGILMSCYSWFVIFTLYKQYTILQITMLQRATMPIAIAMHRDLALVESGYNPSYNSTYNHQSYGRNKIGIQ